MSKKPEIYGRTGTPILPGSALTDGPNAFIIFPTLSNFLASIDDFSNWSLISNFLIWVWLTKPITHKVKDHGRASMGLPNKILKKLLMRNWSKTKEFMKNFQFLRKSNHAKLQLMVEILRKYISYLKHNSSMYVYKTAHINIQNSKIHISIRMSKFNVSNNILYLPTYLLNIYTIFKCINNIGR